MATDNYFKVRRAGTSRSVEFFFDSKNYCSRTGALLAAREYAGLLDEGLPPGDPDARPAALSVWEHGVEGFGDLHCIGGCDICAPKILEEVDDEPSAA